MFQAVAKRQMLPSSSSAAAASALLWRRCKSEGRLHNLPYNFNSISFPHLSASYTNKNYNQNLIPTPACPRRWYGSPSSFPLHHAADSELVLPTLCISPHHLHCFHYQALCACPWSLQRRAAPGRFAWEEERLERNNTDEPPAACHNNEPCVKHSQAN